MNRAFYFGAILIATAFIIVACNATGGATISDQVLKRTVGGAVTCDYPQPVIIPDEYKCEYCVQESSELWKNCNPKTPFGCHYLATSGPQYRPECFARELNCGGKFLLWTDECITPSAVQGVNCNRTYPHDTAGGSGAMIDCPPQ